jgi:hypothetical protein
MPRHADSLESVSSAKLGTVPLLLRRYKRVNRQIQLEACTAAGCTDSEYLDLADYYQRHERLCET